MDNKKIIGKIWIMFSSVMTAISFIDIGHSLGVAILRWSELFMEVARLYKDIRDVLIFPFMFVFNMLPFESESFRNLVFISLFIRSVQMQLHFKFGSHDFIMPHLAVFTIMNYMIVYPFIYFIVIWGISAIIGKWLFDAIAIILIFLIIINTLMPYFNRETFISRKEFYEASHELLRNPNAEDESELLKKGKILSTRFSTTHYHNSFLRVIVIMFLIAVFNYFYKSFELGQ
jgi:hypothetical protein